MTRNMAIKWLKWIQNMFSEDSEQYKALQLGIDSMEVDEAYQLEYEKTTSKFPAVEGALAEMLVDGKWIKGKNKGFKDGIKGSIPKAEIKKFLEEGTKDVGNNVLAIVREDYIHKADYEKRLKADMVAILVELQLEIEKQCKIPNNCASAYDWNNGVYACYKAVQQKIKALKADSEDV